MKKRSWVKRLRMKAKKGFRGYPVGTVAFYGPDDRKATKVAAGIAEDEEESVEVVERWFSEDLDIRKNPSVGREVEKFFRNHHVKSVVVTRGILGCPHEEGIDYPEGEACPECPFWKNKDRWENA